MFDYVVVDDWEGFHKKETLQLFEYFDTLPYYINETDPDSERKYFSSVLQPRIEDFGNLNRGNSPFYMPVVKLVFDIFSSQNIYVNNIGRINLNITFPCQQKYSSKPHVDHKYSYYQMIIYLNDSDGDTILYSKIPEHEGKFSYENNFDMKEYARISPKKNRILIFDGEFPHTSETPSVGLRKILVSSAMEMDYG